MCFGELCLHAVGNDYEMRRKKLASIIGMFLKFFVGVVMSLRITSSRLRVFLTGLIWIIGGVWFVSEIPSWRTGESFPYESLSAFLLGFLPLLELRGQGDKNSVLAYDFSSPRHQQNRQNVIANVRMACTARLQQALHEAIYLTLELTPLPRALSRPMVLWEGKPIERQTITSDEIVTTFDNCGQALLILGAPGSGKTFTLLKLCNGLLERADKNSANPIPIVLNLSTWAEQKKPLDGWIVDEMLRQYGLAKPVTKAWLAQAHLCLLLDGLDEVREDIGSKCVQAINDFRANHVAPLAICSRTGSYEVLSHRLNLSQALVIRPLEEEQVAQYLTDPKMQLAVVYDAVQEDDALRELSTMPLMLDIMSVAYRGVAQEELQPLIQTEESRRVHLYNAYVKRAFTRRPLQEEGYSTGQALKWLRYLAVQLSQRSQTQVFVEDLQLDWLSPFEQHQTQYLLATWLMILFGVFFGVLGGGLFSVRYGFQTAFLAGFLVGFWCGLLVGFWISRPTGVPANVMVGILAGIPIGFLFGVPSSVLSGILVGVLCSVLSGVLYSRTSKDGWHIGIVDQLSIGELSWHFVKSALWNDLLFGVLGSFLFGLLFGFLYGDLLGILIGILFGGSLGILFGSLVALIRPVESKRRLRPSEGIHSSIANAQRGGLIFGLLGGVLFGVLFGVLSGVLSGILPYVIIGVLCGVIIGGLKYGGAAIIRHYALRGTLARHDHLPFRIEVFLEAMHSRILVRQTGPSYLFIHRTFQEHIAALTDEQIGHLAASVDAQPPT